MKKNTRLFGEIDISDDKLIRFRDGIVGFPFMKDFALINDEEKENSIMWLQSMDEEQFALPVIDPYGIMPDYKPTVDDELLKSIDYEDQIPFVLVTLTVPPKIEDLTANLKAPIIINTDNNKGVQVIVEDDYEVKYHIYDLLKKKED